MGTDIVSVSRITALLADHGEAFLGRWFTPTEIAYCQAKSVPGRHVAARWAAKEAVVKAVRVPWDGPLPWRSIEIVNDDRGIPSVRLSGAAAQAAAAAGVHVIDVSLSHGEEYATATVIVAVDPGPIDTTVAGSEG